MSNHTLFSHIWETVLFCVLSFVLLTPFPAGSTPSARGAPPDLLILSPEPDTPIQGGRQVIAISVLDADGDVDPSSIQLQVDGRDCTRQADVSLPLVTYTPDRPFSPGPHQISVQAADFSGNHSGPMTWTFTVQSPRPKLFNIRGDLQIGIQYDRPSRPLPNRPRWDNQIRLDLKGAHQGVEFSSRLYLTSQETPFLTTEHPSKGQPLNRYSFTARTRWFRLTLGDAYPMWDELTLRGLVVRGIHMALYWGPAHLTWIRGITRRAINPTSLRKTEQVAVWLDERTYVTTDGRTAVLTETDEVASDSTSVAHLDHRSGSFRRSLTAARVGFRIGEPFDLSLHLLHAEDDTNSVHIPTALRTQHRPKENLSVVLRSTLHFNHRRSLLSAEVGETVLTDNLFSTLSDTTLTEDIPTFVQRLIKVNASTRTTLDLSDPSKNLVPPVYIFRLQTPFSVYHYLYSHLNAELYRIPSRYASLGSPQQRNDMQGFRFNIQSRLWEGQLIADVEYDRYSDNVDESQIHTTTTRTITTQITWTPVRWPRTSPSATVGLRSYGQKSTVQSNTSRTITLGLRGRVHTAPLLHQIYMNGMYLAYRDRLSSRSFDVNALSITLHTIFPNPFSLSSTAGVTVNQDKGKHTTTAMRVLTLNAAYALRQDRLNLHGTLTAFTRSNGISAHDSGSIPPVNTAKYTVSIGSDCRLSAIHRVQGQLAWTRFTDRVNPMKSYTEPHLEFTYRYRF